jgi:hypothetical protein
MTPRRLAYAVAAVVASSAIMSGGALVAAIKVDADSNMQWCDLLVPLDERNKKIPPPNADSKRFADSIHRLRNNFDC